MKRKIIAVLVAAGVLFMFGCNTVKKEESKATKVEEKKLTGTNVVVHYYRYEGDYSGYILKAWGKEVDGKDFEFKTSDDFGKVAVVKFDKKVADLGLGVVNDALKTKEVKNNRHVDKLGESIGEVWIVQGDENVYYSKKEAPNSPKVATALIEDINKINVTMTNIIKNEKTFKVTDLNGKELSITDVKKIDDKRAVITTKENLDVSTKYIVSAEGFRGEKTQLGRVLEKEAFFYNGDDLGNVYSKDETAFKVWTPVSSKVDVLIFDNSSDKDADIYPMTREEKGIWSVKVKGDLNNKQYLYRVNIDGQVNEVVDPYAKCENTNGKRGIIFNTGATNPVNWDKDSKPVLNPYSNTNNYVDYILWEIHVRDFSISENSGMKNKGKYLAFTENDTTLPTNPEIKTGVAHLKELGITAVHINPMYDFGSVDESGQDKTRYYNWGYDPDQYNTPEGSYATNPDDTSRVNEVKRMIQNLHANGIRAVMDVVYNHTYTKGDSIYDKLVPKYYYRLDAEGDYSSASGCGNEVASEKLMARKFIIDSVKYWAKEYHIDGFRFDLMGIIDRDTMIAVEKELHAIDPAIIIYGEPWYCGDTPLDPMKQMTKGSQQGLNIAIFNDNIRDSVKGNVFSLVAPGFVQGKKGMEGDIKRGVIGSIIYGNPEIDGKEVPPYYKNPDRIVTATPNETINYVSCHDNLTLYDKLLASGKDEGLKIQMNKLSQAIVFTSQGIPLILAGEEMLRTKNKNENSYNSGDKDNQIDWSRKEKYKDVFNYYKGLIELRKKHAAFRMTKAEDVKNNLKFYSDEEMKAGDKKVQGVVAYKINAKNVGDEWNEIVVIYNGNKESIELKLPDGNNGGEWTVVTDNDEAGVLPVKTATNDKVVNGKFKGDTFVVPNTTCVVMYR